MRYYILNFLKNLPIQCPALVMCARVIFISFYTTFLFKLKFKLNFKCVDSKKKLFLFKTIRPPLLETPLCRGIKYREFNVIIYYLPVINHL